MGNKLKSNREVIRVGGRLKELTIIKDEAGNVIHKILSPLMLEFKPKDILQVIVGSTILAIPLAYTQEVWDLGTSMSMRNIFFLLLLSLTFISGFVYYTYYRKDFKSHYIEFIKRSFSTYVFSFLIVTLILALIGKAPWTVDWVLAFKRTVLVAFPASMSATIADTIK